MRALIQRVKNAVTSARTQAIQIPDSGVLVDALIATADLPGLRLPSSGYNVNERGFISDNGGNSFDGYLQTSGNQTMVHLFKRNTQGVVVAQAAVEARGPQGQPLKMNSAVIRGNQSNVIIKGTGYELTSPERTHYPVAVVWSGVFVPFAAGVDPESGAGPEVFVGNSEPNPEPQVEIDYARIERAIEAWARTTIGNIIPKTQYAFIEGLDEENDGERERQFRNALFPYLKNAAANPLANVLGGLDPWGDDRRDELKAIIQEAVREMQAQQ